MLYHIARAINAPRCGEEQINVAAVLLFGGLAVTRFTTARRRGQGEIINWLRKYFIPQPTATGFQAERLPTSQNGGMSKDLLAGSATGIKSLAARWLRVPPLGQINLIPLQNKHCKIMTETAVALEMKRRDNKLRVPIPYMLHPFQIACHRHTWLILTTLPLICTRACTHNSKSDSRFWSYTHQPLCLISLIMIAMMFGVEIFI